MITYDQLPDEFNCLVVENNCNKIGKYLLLPELNINLWNKILKDKYNIDYIVFAQFFDSLVAFDSETFQNIVVFHSQFSPLAPES